jgi:hypothetical protein
LRQKKNEGRWVAYHGDERVGIARTKPELVREIVRRSIPRDESYVTLIRPRDLPPWEPEEIEPTHPHHLENGPAKS